MKNIGVLAVSLVLVSLHVSPLKGQLGVMPDNLIPGTAGSSTGPSLSESETQLNASDSGPIRTQTGFHVPSQQPSQQVPSGQEQQMQSRYPQYQESNQQQQQQQQQPTQYPQQKSTQYPQQQSTQYPQQQQSTQNSQQFPQQQQSTQNSQQFPQQQQSTQNSQQFPQQQQSTQNSQQFPQQQQTTQTSQQYPEQQQKLYPQQYPQQQQQQQQPKLPTQQLPLDDAVRPQVSDTNSTAANGTAENAITSKKTLPPNATDFEHGNRSTVPMMTTPSITTTTTAPEPEKTGMDQKNGEAESLVDYALGLAGYNSHNNDEKGEEKESATSNPATATVSPTPTANHVSDCNIPATLESCGMPADVQKYFVFNVSVQGVLASIFKPETVHMLSQQCQPGSWCLPYDKHQEIMDGMDKFYLDGPLCSVAMWSCMERVLTSRRACDDKELKFLMASVQTLCDLSEFGLTDKRCYTRTVEALYATYTNTFPPPDKKPVANNSNFCESYTAKMTKTYLCADDSCSYDQMIVLERFQPWVELVNNATSVSSYCNITQLCQYEEEKDYIDEMEDELEEDYGDYANNYYDYGYSEEAEEDEDEGDYGDEDEEEGRGYGEADDYYTLDQSRVGDVSSHVAPGEQFGDVEVNKQDPETLATKENIALGLIVVCAMVGVVVMCLFVFIYKKFQSSQAGSNWGYSKLAEEEGRLAHYEYS